MLISAGTGKPAGSPARRHSRNIDLRVEFLLKTDSLKYTIEKRMPIKRNKNRKKKCILPRVHAQRSQSWNDAGNAYVPPGTPFPADHHLPSLLQPFTPIFSSACAGISKQGVRECLLLPLPSLSTNDSCMHSCIAPVQSQYAVCVTCLPPSFYFTRSSLVACAVLMDINMHI